MAKLCDISKENEKPTIIKVITGSAEEESTDTDAYTVDDQHSSNIYHELNSNSFEKALEATREKETPRPKKIGQSVSQHSKQLGRYSNLLLKWEEER